MTEHFVPDWLSSVGSMVLVLHGSGQCDQALCAIYTRHFRSDLAIWLLSSTVQPIQLHVQIHVRWHFHHYCSEHAGSIPRGEVQTLLPG